MFIANFPEGGFKIFSNNLTQPMVLVRSEKGSFNPHSLIGNPMVDYVKQLATGLRTEARLDKTIVDSSWVPFLETRATPSEGRWYLAGTAMGYDINYTTPKGGRLPTKWGQESPFNNHCPYILNTNDHCPVGCTAVATGQYLAHSHRYFSKPTTAPTQAVYNEDDNSFEFSNFNANPWSYFINTANQSTGSANLTSMFLGYVAQSIHTEFSAGNSATSVAHCRNFVNSQTSQSLIHAAYDFNRVKKCISSGRPVIGFSEGYRYGAVAPTGHVFLIDCIVNEETSFYDVYVYGTPPAPDEDADDMDLVTINDFIERFGTIDARLLSTNTTYWVKMNWGWNGLDDDVELNSNLKGYDLGGFYWYSTSILIPSNF